MEGCRRVPLLVSNRKAYVWNVDDIAVIRTECRVCGTLLGTLPHLSQQNAFLGVPLVLQPEEAVLLVDKELAVLIDDPAAHSSPELVALERWNSEWKELIQKQISALEAKDARDHSKDRSTSEKAQQKREQREARRAAAIANKIDTDAGPVAVKDPIQAPRPPQTVPAYTIVVPGTSTSFSWYTPAPHTYTTIQAAKDAGIWSYPSDLTERAKCAVFRDLWDKGYYMGGGLKFGGDYLVYPGDPLRYHSHFTATVIESPNKTVMPMEVVAHGRLGTATRKTHLFCTWDEKAGKVSYVSIEWAGFG
ncbi:tRNA-intron endonuclease catalytic domain-like protein [Thelephora ganbajun]|uniref:tRNA-intron endonuclease catalytic domain-like protein n=1 Tax=Thelephora ganbajun TaxID=370292 RepID=A0ACB6ZNK8_THEGA|nr:tRNA-intron endonuclease catalytic domain-like protein [Thelephora ganbajun]